MFEFEVRPDAGEPFHVTAAARDVVVWEKTSRNQMTLARLMEDLSMSELYRLCHIAARRQQLFTGTLQDLEETADLDFEETDDNADPTQTARLPGSRSRSHSRPASRPASGQGRESEQS